MFNEPMERALQRLVDRINNPRTSPRLRRYLEKVLRDTLDARRGYDYRIEELEMLLLRNPAFPGDMVGYWDEFIDEEDDDENEDEARSGQ